MASSGLLRFVPVSRPVSPYDLERLQQFLNEAKRLIVLTGAGLSTESGIPGVPIFVLIALFNVYLKVIFEKKPSGVPQLIINRATPDHCTECCNFLCDISMFVKITRSLKLLIYCHLVKCLKYSELLHVPLNLF